MFNKNKLHEDNKNFYKILATLAIPIILQNLITSSLNLVDNLMIGSLGENEIASVGLANQYFFVFILTLAGITGGASIFMSQYYGKKDIKKIKSFTGILIIFSTTVSILFAGIALLSPESIMRIFTSDHSVISLGKSYLQIASLSYIFTAITQTYSTPLRSTNQAKIPMCGSIIGIAANACLNYIFIFGKFGVPAMGVAGAALGTTISRFLEMIYILYMVYIKNNLIRCNIHDMKFKVESLRSFINTSTPVILNDVMWSLGISFYSISYAKVGTSAVASMQIATTVSNMFVIFGTGLAAACAIIIGNRIGEDKSDLAISYSHRLSKLSLILGIFIGVIFFISSPMIVSIFNIADSTRNITLIILRIMAIILPLKFFNIVLIIGVFRGGGDVNYAIFTELICVWFIAVPASYLGATIFNQGIIVVFLLVCLEEIFKLFFEIPRFKSGKWLRKVI